MRFIKLLFSIKINYFLINISVELKTHLDDYIDKKYPKGLVKLIHNPVREGLIKARLKGWKASVGEVIVFFDSHMEVNIDWYVLLETAVNRSFHIIPSRVTRNSREQIISHYPLTCY